MQFIGAICEESLKLWLGNSRSLRHPQCQIWQKLSEKRQTFLQVGKLGMFIRRAIRITVDVTAFFLREEGNANLLLHLNKYRDS